MAGRVLLLSIVVSLPSAVYRISAFFVWLWALPVVLTAQQAPPLPVEVVRIQGLDTVQTTPLDSTAIYTPNKKRLWTATGLHLGIYGGTLLLLNEAWYKGYPKTDFQTFDDSREWLQVDKVGHAWSAYQLSRVSMASWQWAGLSPNKSAWIGGLSGFAFQTVIEMLDAHSAEWGWSWSDIAANAFGSGLLIAQQQAWGDQRIGFKFSFHRVNYHEPDLQRRADQLFGSSLAERMLKDYNGQTYWLSANLQSFFKQSKIPRWLNVAVGYGATGMFGGFTNKWTDKTTGIQYDRTDIPRVREWYLSPDIDFTRIKTNKKWVRSLLFCLNAFKLPAPALAFSNGRFRVYGLYF